MTITQYTSRECDAFWRLSEERRWLPEWTDAVTCLDAPDWIPDGSHVGFDGPIGRGVSSLGVWRDWQ